ncbi:exodeoxyribonuclease III [Ancylobacter pratisalsi]|uniref:Exodeoxyribonuclease III n=1 Tax=Ancylobacter pratisalsi TaxID=1745854 RepID=A0A6P1YS54_9HYPH|nr:exodeoxyribonuclease III [Ancylobacter pratisalsi]QIB35621.1 exodeoxyribonuclease III [Ancylobacter pratisalsi]
MRIATWNVNSVRLRLDNMLAWLGETRPDVVCLQEIKCQDEQFPREAFEQAGYNVAVHGQKAFNGVAVLSRLPIDEVKTGLPGDDGDVQSRFIEVVVSIPDGVVRVCGIYLPNGNPVGSEKYPYKLDWMARLKAHISDRLALEEPLVICGDYNVIPEPKDAARPELWVDDALFLPETRAAFREIINLGLTDALRAASDEGGLYSFWDYQAGAWQKNNGIRIDHLLLSPQAADRLKAVGIDKHVRGWEKPSDHVPVWADLAIGR